jgi:quercetin dioxygenase-like cupin family protein
VKLVNQDNQKHEKDFTEEAVQLTSLVDYQNGSIVSRTLIDEETGTVTLFAFDKGQGLSEHTAPYDAMVYLLDGEVEITISGKPLHMRRGEMIIMPADIPHALRAVKRFKMILTMIRS